MKGAPVTKALTERLVPQVETLVSQGVRPTLAIVRVGEREDDLSYERGATKSAEKVGLGLRKFALSVDCTQESLAGVIREVSEDPGIHGCLLFRPLPKTLDETAICTALDPAKDVDCITQGSLYGVFAGQPVGFPPCTAEAVVELLDYYQVPLEGAKVTVVGRSLVIGKPVSMMLQARNATVTMCHTRTRDLAAACRDADIVVAAAGHIGTVGEACASSRQVVVDVGINWDEKAQKLVGDVDFDAVEPIVRAITPVPGGVGSVTTAVLAKHVIEATQRTVER
ncbi:tetrahydrofolate dehydrogenase/cyclohydrolase catalytic domain-containing protein [Olsenella sp. Marseille-P4559]|uniref:bifunctional 5,10-methylenetetrahydrofolate dehydrogenase/5,10-methenyltetrahydrofolate cyclohydrolase n=1 Tax=Olsenella sp. Marseille-P4559 TaxID=2364795 RepID=UPI0010313D7E